MKMNLRQKLYRFLCNEFRRLKALLIYLHFWQWSAMHSSCFKSLQLEFLYFDIYFDKPGMTFTFIFQWLPSLTYSSQAVNEYLKANPGQAGRLFL